MSEDIFTHGAAHKCIAVDCLGFAGVKLFKPPPSSGLICCPFPGGYSDAVGLALNSSIVVNCCAVANCVYIYFPVA